jgi:hypothetical protein
MNAQGYYEELTGTEKVKAVKFDVTRAEGRIEECKSYTVTTWAKTDSILRSWARTAPDEGQGYNKCDFTVTYEDGETYTGRYDLKRHDMGFTDLLGYHIRSFVEFCAGQHKPDHMTAAQYQEYLSDSNKEEYAQFLLKYEIGNEQSKQAPVLEVVHDPKPEPKPRYMKTNKADLPKTAPIRTEVINRWEKDPYHVEVWPGKAIRIYGSYSNHVNGPVDYDITFKIGDRAEYDSYNLKYVGDIVAIGPKTVTIKHYAHSDEKSRLDFGKFAWRNWDFDAQETSDYNANESMYI